MSDSLIGRVLAGRYRIDEAVSEELLGRVHIGFDTVDNCKVLIKVLHAHLAKDAKRFARFVREVRATAMVRHVNTIELLDSGSEGHTHFLIMEYFPAHTLEDEMVNGPISIQRAAHIAAQIASAIGVAHQESITHRALSFRNVLLLENARNGDFVKVRDFGLSKLERFDDDAENSNLTEAGVRVGNTAYMAPEYIDRDRFHPKGDLYALGCMLFHMVTGRPPYVGRAADVLSAHVMGRVPTPRDHSDAVPEWMDVLVQQLLSKTPEDRPGAYQVVQQLEAGVGYSLAPPPLGDVNSRHSPAPKPLALVEEEFEEETLVPARGPSSATLTAVLSIVVLLAVFAAILGLSSMGVVYLLQPDAQPTRILGATPEPRVIVVPPLPGSPEASPSPAPSVDSDSEPEVAAPVEPVRTGLKVSANRRALVLINGVIKGYSPVEINVPPGNHTVEAMMPGDTASRQKQQLRVRKGERPSVLFSF